MHTSDQVKVPGDETVAGEKLLGHQCTRLSTIELEAKARMEADHRQTRLWYAEVAEWAPECTEG